MVVSLLTTKLYIPPAPLKIVPRERLVRRLNETLDRKLTILSAPAGFGKTTLLSEWIQWISTYKREPDNPNQPLPCAQELCLAQSALPDFIWVALDEHDNTPRRFWRYFLAALESLDIKIGNELLGELVSSQELPEEALTDLISEILASRKNHFVMVLDDYQSITAQSIHDAIGFLLANLPSIMHLVISSRETPPFQLSQLRARNQLVELHANDLRFTLDESTAFLTQSMGLELQPSAVSTLNSHTEGWAVGLQLAALSIRECGDSAGCVQSFDGTHRYIVDYLAEQVIDRMPDIVLRFLLQTCILSRLNAKLCDDMLGDQEWGQDGENSLFSSSQDVLEYLERANLFLVPLDDGRNWYRYHHLFAEFLQQRLRKTEPERWIELHLRAARFFESRGMLEDAVQHSLEAQDFETAGHLIERTADKLYRNNEILTLIGWMKALPDTLIESRPMLALMYAWGAAINGRMDIADRILALLENREEPAIIANVATIRAFSARFHSNLEETIAYSLQALENITPEQVWMICPVLLYQGHAHLWSGNDDKALHILNRAKEMASSIGHSTIYFNALHYLARLQVLHGKLLRAKQLYKEALQ